MVIEAETVMMCPQTEECQGPLATANAQGKPFNGFPYNLQRGYGPADILISDIQPPELRQYISVVYIIVCGILLQQPKQTNTIAISDFSPLISSQLNPIRFFPHCSTKAVHV